MTKVAIVFHSAWGHTEAIAHCIANGASAIDGVTVDVVKIGETTDELKQNVEQLQDADAIVFGAPTYLGSVSAQFKMFMDASSGAWFQQQWKDKLAAGFTVGGAMSGDKLGVLIQLSMYAAQHGMVWVGQAEANTSPDGKQGDPEAINRMGSTLGLMAQADNAGPEVTPPSGDRKTAELFGKRIATMAQKLRA
jgi:multimeric flavodoxin WrbA